MALENQTHRGLRTPAPDRAGPHGSGLGGRPRGGGERGRRPRADRRRLRRPCDPRARVRGAGNQRVGCGFITWSMARDPSLLDAVLARAPAALMLSFADPAPFAERIHAAGVPLICQVHTLAHARRALEVGAAVVVAQGTEAGGHGLAARGTLAFVPAVADLIARERPETLLLAAGGIADGRGLAAALALGADGVLMGTRFWATREALIHPAAKAAGARGHRRRHRADAGLRHRPAAGLAGALYRSAPAQRLHRDLARPRGRTARGRRSTRRRDVEDADAAGDYDVANVTVGEAVGLIDDLPERWRLVRRIAEAAEAASCAAPAGSRRRRDGAPQSVTTHGRARPEPRRCQRLSVSGNRAAVRAGSRFQSESRMRIGLISVLSGVLLWAAVRARPARTCSSASTRAASAWRSRSTGSPAIPGPSPRDREPRHAIRILPPVPDGAHAFLEGVG